MTTPNTPTPRTDAREFLAIPDGNHTEKIKVVFADDYRQLERELSEANKLYGDCAERLEDRTIERDKWKADACALADALECCPTEHKVIGWDRKNALSAHTKLLEEQ